jgi:hypothetical protein
LFNNQINQQQSSNSKTIHYNADQINNNYNENDSKNFQKFAKYGVNRKQSDQMMYFAQNNYLNMNNYQNALDSNNINFNSSNLFTPNMIRSDTKKKDFLYKSSPCPETLYIPKQINHRFYKPSPNRSTEAASASFAKGDSGSIHTSDDQEKSHFVFKFEEADDSSLTNQHQSQVQQQFKFSNQDHEYSYQHQQLLQQQQQIFKVPYKYNTKSHFKPSQNFYENQRLQNNCFSGGNINNCYPNQNSFQNINNTVNQNSQNFSQKSKNNLLDENVEDLDQLIGSLGPNICEFLTTQKGSR